MYLESVLMMPSFTSSLSYVITCVCFSYCHSLMIHQLTIEKAVYNKVLDRAL